MHAYFDANDGNPKVVLKICGTRRNYEKEIAALVDTGHTGSLSLPILDLIEIGAKLTSVGPVEYADGNTATVYYFSVKVIIDGEKKEVEAGMIKILKLQKLLQDWSYLTPILLS